VEQVYGDHFPLDVRFQLALWIEENFFSVNVEIKPEDPSSQSLAAQLAQQLLRELDATADSIPNDPDKFLMKQKLIEVSHNLKSRYGGNLVALYIKVRQCLEMEHSIVSQYASVNGSTSPFTLEQSKDQKIRQALTELQHKIGTISLQLDNCKQETEIVTSDIYSFKDFDSRLTQLKAQLGETHEEVKKMKAARDKMENQVKQKLQGLATLRNNIFNEMVMTVRQVREVQTEVLDSELIAWKRQQQLAGNGLQITLSLETLQEFCEALAGIIWTTRTHIKQLETLRATLGDNSSSTVTSQQLTTEITELLSNLVTGTFIIEKQPPQVMKTNTRFTATVRLLVGGQLNVHMASPSVSVSIISESQARQLLNAPNQTQKRREDYSSGDILNSNGNMEYHAATRQVSVTFRNLQLKKIKRTEKKGTESVMEEKFSVLFWTEFQVGELKFQVWTLSLPVVVIVHGNQEPQALATITWDNAFAEWGRPPFRVPDKVSWAKMAEALNMKWTSQCGTNRSLTNDNIYYLACKAFRNPHLHRDDFKNLTISWSQFCRESLPDRTFTFWEWFYRIMVLTSNHLKGPWSEGYIMGFVSKQEVEQILIDNSMVNGTFILRFSDSEIGGITIAYVRQDPQNGTRTVFMVAPFTTKDLSQRSIADVVFDLDNSLTFVYQFPMEGGPKALEVFRKFSSQNQTNQPTATGYVPHQLKTHVSGPASGGYEGIGFMSPHGSEWPDTEYAYSAEDNSMQESELNTGHLLDILGIVNSNMDVQM